MDCRFHPQALEDYLEASLYYAERDPVLALRFVEAIEDKFCKLHNVGAFWMTIYADASSMSFLTEFCTRSNPTSSSASILRDGRVVFNIAGNKYRIVVWINYPHRVVYIRFIGTHEQYDKIDAQTI